MSEISVCYSGNRRVFPGLLLSVLSLVRHTDRPLHVFVLSMDLRGEDLAFLPFSQAQQDLFLELLFALTGNELLALGLQFFLFGLHGQGQLFFDDGRRDAPGIETQGKREVIALLRRGRPPFGMLACWRACGSWAFPCGTWGMWNRCPPGRAGRGCTAGARWWR